MQITLTFINPLNCSVSPGDTVYYTPVSLGGGFSVSPISMMNELGTVVSIGGTYLEPEIIIKNNTMSIAPTITGSTFISFRKNKKVNLTSLKGYYAEAKFENNSKEKAELFAVGSEIVQSSK